jgi:hypothetical protein
MVLISFRITLPFPLLIKKSTRESRRSEGRENFRAMRRFLIFRRPKGGGDDEPGVVVPVLAS